jgi:hypothetical protein
MKIILISTFKPFNIHYTIQQRNSLESWKRLVCNPTIIIVGNDEGVADICKEYDIIHEPDVKLGPSGVPQFNDIFEKGWKYATEYDICIYINGDIILRNDLCHTLNAFVQKYPDYYNKTYLLTARRYDWINFKPIDFNDSNWSNNFLTLITEGSLSDPHSIDIFIHRKNTLRFLPESYVGSWNHDTVLLAYACKYFDITINISKTCLIYHQEDKFWINNKAYDRKENRPIKEEEIINLKLLDFKREIFGYDYDSHIGNCKFMSYFEDDSNINFIQV